jgi:hypothetical protein
VFIIVSKRFAYGVNPPANNILNVSDKKGSFKCSLTKGSLKGSSTFQKDLPME